MRSPRRPQSPRIPPDDTFRDNYGSKGKPAVLEAIKVKLTAAGLHVSVRSASGPLMLLVRSSIRLASEQRAGRWRPEDTSLGNACREGDGNANFAAVNAS